MILAGTGHRPRRLGGFESKNHERLRRFLEAQLIKIQPDHVLSGMAVGFDQALAEAASLLGIPFIGVIPFIGQEKRWPISIRRHYLHLCESAEDIVIVSEGGFDYEKLQIRNQWLVDHCNLLLALWDGTPSGTANCIAYAKKKKRPYRNVWQEWLDWEKAS